MFLTNQDQPVEIKVIESVKKRMNSKSRPQHPKHHNTVLQSCAWCGKRHSHGREYCPAKSLVCVTNVKKKRGHFQTVCRSRSKTVRTIGGDESSVFMGTIHGNVETVNISSDSWNVTLLLDGISVQFKMDTGADVTAIPSRSFDKFTSV